MAGELVATGDGDVIVTLLENSGAKIAQSTLSYLVDESRRVDSFQQPILRRQELDPELAKKMFLWVSAALRSYIVQRYKFDSATLDELLERAGIEGAERAALESAHTPADTLATDLAKDDKINTELLLSTLRQRQVHLFISMLVRATGLRRTLITRFLMEASGEGLAIICKSLSINQEQFLEIYKLTGKARSTRATPVPSEAVSELYARMSQETADKVVHHWHRDSEYLNAVRMVDQARHDAA